MTDNPNTPQDGMPEELYACPRGSGTISGVWTDAKCGDEPETRYIRADKVDHLYQVIADLARNLQDYLDLARMQANQPGLYNQILDKHAAIIAVANERVKG